MYLPSELSPEDSTRYVVVRTVRSTGVREVVYISTDKGCALDVAKAGGDFVIELSMIGDFR